MIDAKKYPVLSKVDDPSNIRGLELPKLKQLCKDIRDYLVDTISETGGHFGGGLGTKGLGVEEAIITAPLQRFGHMPPNVIRKRTVGSDRTRLSGTSSSTASSGHDLI